MSDILHLPYPYEQFKRFEQRRANYDFEKYKTKVFGWVDKNINPLQFGFKYQWLYENYYRLIEKKEHTNREIFKVLFNHLDKLMLLYDFSGVEFGINIDERSEKFLIVYPGFIEPDDQYLYPNYDFETFKSFSPIEKLNWMLNNCEFVPIRVIHDEDHYLC